MNWTDAQQAVIASKDQSLLVTAAAGSGKTAVLVERIIEKLTDEKAPLGNRIAYVAASYFKLLKQDESFIKASDLAQNMLVKGQVGMVDGIPIIVVPASYMPAKTAFIITNPIACCAPVKLADYKIHDNPPGINGWLVEGRVRYDAFVLENKKGAIYVHKTAAEK